MKYREFLITGVGIVIYIFAAFGGFLKNIAPPDSANPRFAVGFSSFIVLLIMLLIAGSGRRQSPAKQHKFWLKVGIVSSVVAIASGLFYYWNNVQFVYQYPPESAQQVRHIRGWRFTDKILGDFKSNPEHAKYEDDPGELELKRSYDEIWTPESVAQVKFLLLANYILVVLSISTAIFSFSVANLRSSIRT